MSEYKTLQENQSLNFEYEINKKEREMKEEIERLNNDLGDMAKLFAKEREQTNRLNNIIKEVREYIEEKEETLLTCDEEWLDHDELIDKKRFTTILKILDKGE